MADLDDNTLQDDDTNTNAADEADENILILDREREASVDEDNPLLIAEKEAIKEEQFSEPDAVNQDLGIVDENEVYAKEYEAGAGAKVDEEDFNTMGMHIEEFADSTNTTSDVLEDLDDDISDDDE